MKYTSGALCNMGPQEEELDEDDDDEDEDEDEDDDRAEELVWAG